MEVGIFAVVAILLSLIGFTLARFEGYEILKAIVSILVLVSLIICFVGLQRGIL